MAKEDKICVIVPTKTRGELLEECILALAGLNFTNFEVIIVNDGRDDITPAVFPYFKRPLTIISSNGRGPSFARNLAANNTDAEYIAFTDSDCIVDKDWLSELLKGFEKYPDAAACGGAQNIPADALPFEKNVFRFMKKTGFLTEYMRRPDKNNGIIEVNHNASCNVMYKRDVFLKEGGFLEGLWPGEDVELDYRLKKKGYRIVFNPKAVVYHHRPKNISGFLSMMYRYGKAQGGLVRKYGFFRKIQLLPFLCLAGVLLFSFSLFFDFTSYFLLFIAAVVIVSFGYFSFNPHLFALAFLGFICWNMGFLKGILNG